MEIPRDDPAVAWLLPEAEEAEPRPGEVEAALEDWVAAAAGWCIEQIGLPIGELVARPGWIALTRTHLDVSFPFERTDIRIRRAGVDINPGWVSWLGRVVTYWYVDQGLPA